MFKAWTDVLQGMKCVFGLNVCSAHECYKFTVVKADTYRVYSIKFKLQKGCVFLSYLIYSYMDQYFFMFLKRSLV